MIRKSTLREIKTSLARYLAILSIVALGVGFYSGLQMCKPDMIDTADDYLQKTNLYDYEIMTSYGIDDKSVKIAESTDGVVKAEPAIEQDIIINTGGEEETILKAITLPDEINRLQLCAGRMPESADECVIDNYYLTGTSFKVGEKIYISDSNKKSDRKKFKTKEFTIVGSVNTPLFLDYERGSTSIGNGSIDTFVYVTEDAFDVDYYTQLYIELEGNEYSFSDELNAKIDSYEKPMEDLAERINDARRETARKDAQKELDEKKQEYEDSLAEYNSEKASTEKKMDKAQSKINSGRRQLDQGEKKAKDGLAQAESQLKTLQTQKSQLQGAMAKMEAAGMTDTDQYRTLQSLLQQVEGGITTCNNGIAEANAGLKEIARQRKKIESGQKELDSGRKTAESEFEDAEARLDDAKEQLDDAQKKIDEMETGNSYSFSRKDNIGYSTFDENATIVKNIAKIFPLFFFLVAALVCMTTMTRMVDEQRSQIGILKALGYSNGTILGKYLFYSGSAAFLGSVIGFFAGCKIFPTVIWHAYTMMYDFDPAVNIRFDWVLGLACTAVAMLCSMGATWMSCAADFGVVPAELIRPKTPKAGKRILLERITPLWKRISFLYKVSFRNVFRYKKRFFMMVLGISGCTALLIAGMGINTTIKGVARFQFSEVIMYDYQIVFNKDMDEKSQDDFVKFADKKTDNYGDMLFVHSATADFVHGDSASEVTLIATDSNRITDYVKLHYMGEEVAYPGEGEVAICRKLHKQYGTEVGDEITVRSGFREMTVKVSGIYDYYAGESMYMTASTYEKGFGIAPEVKSAYVIAPDNADDAKIRETATSLGKYEDVAAVAVNQDLIDRVDSMMESLNAIVYVVILCAGLLAFIVLYNLTNINITERIREIATIKVLGFNQLETSQYVFRENLFLTAIASVVGIPLGKWLLDFVISNINVNMIFFVARITWQNYVMAVVLTFVFAFIVNLAMQRRLRNVSMTESLKSIE